MLGSVVERISCFENTQGGCCSSKGRLYNLLDMWGSRFQGVEKAYLSLTRIIE